ncbi:MAG: translation elongation factor P [Acidobacteriia bacterium]|nr:translation elongation factor P [Terriglobia bacterium]
MILASQIRSGMAIAFEGQTYRVISVDYHPGQGKMGGVTHSHLQNLSTGTLRDYSFRSELKVQEVSLDRQTLEFLYMDGGQCCFMHPDTYEQTELPRETIGPRASLLLPGMKLSIEFLDGRPVNVVFPDVLEVKVTGTAPPLHQQSDTNFKPARLENGIEVLVPQFVKTGDLIRLHVESMKYMARAETRAKHA